MTPLWRQLLSVVRNDSDILGRLDILVVLLYAGVSCKFWFWEVVTISEVKPFLAGKLCQVNFQNLAPWL